MGAPVGLAGSVVPGWGGGLMCNNGPNLFRWAIVGLLCMVVMLIVSVASVINILS